MKGRIAPGGAAAKANITKKSDRTGA